MRIVFIFIVMLAWIAIWGLSDIYTHNWSDEDKTKLYLSILIILGILLLIDPNLLKHF